MRIEEIKHRATLKSIQTYNIDVSLFENIEAIRKHIRSLKSKKYRESNKDYFRDYMYERYNAKKTLDNFKELPIIF